LTDRERQKFILTMKFILEIELYWNNKVTFFFGGKKLSIT